MVKFNTTISAISTAPGTGAIGIVRLSGSDSLSILKKVFKTSFSIESGKVCYGSIFDPETLKDLDNVLVLYFQSPRSYTGEDIVEIHAHGSYYLLETILTLLTKNGAELAQAGEFTKRAFLNGKLDLLQAESVADIIHSQTERSLRFSNQQLQGLLSQKLSALKMDLQQQAALLEIELDFSEEDVEFASRDTLLQNIKNTIGECEYLLKTFQFGRLVHEGVKIVIAGAPNVGKSSILNRLLATDRAIVSEIPGTTRDTIEELLDIQGYLFRIIDTAGLRQTLDMVEEEGVRRSRKSLADADIILHIVDNTNLEHDLDYVPTPSQKIFKIINKVDLVSDSDFMDFACLKISAKTGSGFTELEKSLVRFVENQTTDDIVITKVRHKVALQRTIDSLQHALQSLQSNLSEEFVAMDLRNALNFLGELTGETTTDDILNSIFSQFCIGK